MAEFSIFHFQLSCGIYVKVEKSDIVINMAEAVEGKEVLINWPKKLKDGTTEFVTQKATILLSDGE